MAKLSVRHVHGNETVDVTETFKEVLDRLYETEFIKVHVGNEPRIYNRNYIVTVYESPDEANTAVKTPSPIMVPHEPEEDSGS